MRLHKKRIAVLVGLIFIATSTFGLSRLQNRTLLMHSASSSGYRLVSIQDVPESGEICLPPEHGSSDSNLFASFDEPDENSVLALLRGGSVYAATQQSGGEVNATAEGAQYDLSLIHI